MKKILAIALILFLATLASFTPARADEIPKILKSGFDQYAKAGPKAAIEAWTKGSAIEGSKEALSQANNFRQVQDFYGNFVGYDIVKSKRHSDTSSAYLIEIKYEKGNVFSKFFTYKKPDGTVVINTFNFHTNPEAIWPSSLVLGCDEK